MQAEAEVRALKRGRHAAQPVLESTLPTLRGQGETNFVLPRTIVTSDSSVQTEAAVCPGGDLDELREQLRMKNFTILQLQADMVREQQVREKNLAEKHRRSTESQQICREELREMMQRAESLSEQVSKAKRRSSELQAARDSASHDGEAARKDLEECRARLRDEISVRSELEEERSALKAELGKIRQAGPSEVAGLSEHMMQEHSLEAQAREEAQAALAELQKEETAMVASAADRASKVAASEEAPAAAGSQEHDGWRYRQSKVVQYLQSVQQQVDALKQEMQSVRQPHKPLTAQRASKAKGNVEDARIAKQLERAQHAVGGKELRGMRSSSPETSDDGLQNQLDVNEVRLAAEQARQKLVSEHCDEMDDLVRRHDRERKELFREVNELRSENARMKAGAAAGTQGLWKPMQGVQSHFESQVAFVKKELVAQLSDIQERHRTQRYEDQLVVAELQKNLEQCRSELASSQYEFITLAMLYDKVQQDSGTFGQQPRESSFAQEEDHDERAETPVPSDKFPETLETSHDFQGSTLETTLMTDALPVFAQSGACFKAVQPSHAAKGRMDELVVITAKHDLRSGLEVPVTLLNSQPPHAGGQCLAKVGGHCSAKIALHRGAYSPASSAQGHALSPPHSLLTTTVGTPTHALRHSLTPASSLQAVGTSAMGTPTGATSFKRPC
eukprot:TRINITY_DN19392_c0_g1_i1.p1 TRINITY_DN19392_c0_g1~~TRINITY_DN19392_c0_g1_i1.p1  ORF type:complete len:713 (+),score=184.24 TRINITY_DN19392_c0_g1_i1:111-2141(+)